MENIIALLLAVAVSIFYVLATLLLYKFTKKLKPTVFLAIVLAVMLIKFVLIILLFLLLKHVHIFNHIVFGFSLVALVTAGTVFEVAYLSRKKNLFQ